jgi:hypothetical protein
MLDNTLLTCIGPAGGARRQVLYSIVILERLSMLNIKKLLLQYKINRTAQKKHPIQKQL